MNRKKTYKSKPPRKTKAAEPKAAYGKRIIFFNSFEEMNEYDARESAALSYDERMEHIEMLRKMVFSKYLKDDGNWRPLARNFKIMPPYTNDAGKQL